MDKRNTIKRALIPYVLVICIALLMEVFIFNGRCFESLFFEEKMLGEFGSWIDNESEEGVSSLFIDIGGYKIKNLYLDLSYVDNATKVPEAATVGIAVEDQLLFDGDHMIRPVTERVIMDSVPVSKYVFFPTYGNTEQIRINFPRQEGKRLYLREVKLNAHRPLFFSLGRFLLILVFGLGLCAFRPASKMWKIKVDEAGKNGKIIFLAFYIFITALVLWWTFQNPLNFPGESDSFMPYAELAKALANGRTYVGEQDQTSGIVGGEMSIWHDGVKGVLFDASHA